MLKRVLGLDARPETLDASDALALALCHHQRRGLAHGGGGVPPRVTEAIARGPRASLAARSLAVCKQATRPACAVGTGRPVPWVPPDRPCLPPTHVP